MVSDDDDDSKSRLRNDRVADDVPSKAVDRHAPSGFHRLLRLDDKDAPC